MRISLFLPRSFSFFFFFGFEYLPALYFLFLFLFVFLLFQLTACMDNKHYYDSYYIS